MTDAKVSEIKNALVARKVSYVMSRNESPTDINLTWVSDKNLVFSAKRIWDIAPGERLSAKPGVKSPTNLLERRRPDGRN